MSQVQRKISLRNSKPPKVREIQSPRRSRNTGAASPNGEKKHAMGIKQRIAAQYRAAPAFHGATMSGIVPKKVPAQAGRYATSMKRKSARPGHRFFSAFGFDDADGSDAARAPSSFSFWNWRERLD